MGAYSKDLDALLVMDVAKYKYPHVWIPVVLLYKSLQSWDMCGLWDFPMAQMELAPELLQPVTREHQKIAMQAIGCQATRRGYIIVEL